MLAGDLLPQTHFLATTHVTRITWGHKTGCWNSTSLESDRFIYKRSMKATISLSCSWCVYGGGDTIFIPREHERRHGRCHDIFLRTTVSFPGSSTLAHRLPLGLRQDSEGSGSRLNLICDESPQQKVFSFTSEGSTHLTDSGQVFLSHLAYTHGCWSAKAGHLAPVSSSSA